jgi:hypothetical protein
LSSYSQHHPCSKTLNNTKRLCSRWIPSFKLKVKEYQPSNERTTPWKTHPVI